MFKPAYLKLYQSGELQRRLSLAQKRLKQCSLCARDCKVDRLLDQKGGYCETGPKVKVSSAFAHHGEEDCLRGLNGSGTIFFTSCSLRCVFCQNFDISHSTQDGIEASPALLAGMMLDLQDSGCHNINLVTPSHAIPQILEALLVAVERGLTLPIVYNTSGYDCLETLKLLDGVVDIYMPDLKTLDQTFAAMYLNAPDYPEVVKAAIKEMHRQVGDLILDEFGVALKGLLIRHLVMPGMRPDAEEIMAFLAKEISVDTFINIMDQYRPLGLVGDQKYSKINLRTSYKEHEAVVEIARTKGLHRIVGV